MKWDYYIVRFTLTYGDKTTLQAARGNHQNQIVIAYIPERIGSGTAVHFPGTVPCSGICLISPQSDNYGHSFPVIDEWVQNTFSGRQSSCRICGQVTDFAQPICSTCYSEQHFDWRNYL
jgi:hypothetical protein